MTPLGEYEISYSREGTALVVPPKFIEANWPLLSEIAGLGFPPALKILHDGDKSNSPNFFGMTTTVQGRHHEVVLDVPELLKDSCKFCKEGGQLIPALWAISATTVRIILTSEGIIPFHQYIGARAARRGGFRKHSTEIIHKQIDCSSTRSSRFRARYDAWIIYQAVYGYLQLFNLDEKVDAEEIRKVIRAEKDDVCLKFFP